VGPREKGMGCSGGILGTIGTDVLVSAVTRVLRVLHTGEG
jgi:hypothetical protein